MGRGNEALIKSAHGKFNTAALFKSHFMEVAFLWLLWVFCAVQRHTPSHDGGEGKNNTEAMHLSRHCEEL
jgi:hypothetical protein